MALNRQPDLFLSDPQLELLEDRPEQIYRADPGEVRRDLLRLLAQARAAKTMPWEPRKARLYAPSSRKWRTGCRPRKPNSFASHSKKNCGAWHRPHSFLPAPRPKEEARAAPRLGTLTMRRCGDVSSLSWNRSATASCFRNKMRAASSCTKLKCRASSFDLRLRS